MTTTSSRCAATPTGGATRSRGAQPLWAPKRGIYRRFGAHWMRGPRKRHMRDVHSPPPPPDGRVATQMHHMRDVEWPPEAGPPFIAAVRRGPGDYSKPDSDVLTSRAASNSGVGQMPNRIVRAAN